MPAHGVYVDGVAQRQHFFHGVVAHDYCANAFNQRLVVIMRSRDQMAWY